MRKIDMLAIVAFLSLTSGRVGSADAQESTVAQGASWDDSGYGYMMGPGMMNPHSMIEFGTTGPRMMGWSGGRAAMCSAMGSHIEGRLAYFKAELQITDAQETLWKAYADAVRENAHAMSARCTAIVGQGQPAALSLPDRLDRHEQFMATQLDAIRAMNKALKPLYAALSQTQKQAADQLFWGPMGMM
jgi:hypothetical protein